MRGDQTLFAREDSVQEAWRVVEPVLGPCTPLYEYAVGSWGPPEADRVMVNGGAWHNPTQRWQGR
jgi:glucose-6-phosphate 1-dehydrogenase